MGMGVQMLEKIARRAGTLGGGGGAMKVEARGQSLLLHGPLLQEKPNVGWVSWQCLRGLLWRAVR